MTSQSDRTPFGQGKSTSFEVEWPDLGEISRLRLGHDGSGRPWRCERVVVTNPVRGSSWEFGCGEWFGTGKGHELERELLTAQEPSSAWSDDGGSDTGEVLEDFYSYSTREG